MQSDTGQHRNLDPALRTAIIIANPRSGYLPHHPNRLQEVLDYLHRHDWQAELWFTKKQGEGKLLAQKAVESGAAMVVAAGGDGTINEIIQGLVGSETVLGVLPTGSVNVWAREVGIPLDLHDACDVLVHGQTRSIDLGCVNGHYFLLMVGIGFDAEVTQKVEHKPLKRLGPLGYALAALWYGPGYAGFPVVVRYDDYVIKTRALQVIIGNTQLYAGTFKFTWRARCDDGELDLCIVRKRNLPGRFIVVWDFFRRRDSRHRWVRYNTFSSITIETPRPIAFQIDGDPGGYTPANLIIKPGALKVVIPQRVPDGLFSD
jgi:YegS/Rv2252/BmrU family lipid kinase